MELEQETTVIFTGQETDVNVISSSKDAPTSHEVETEVGTDTHGTDVATTSKNDLAAELPEMEQHVIPTTEVFNL